MGLPSLRSILGALQITGRGCQLSSITITSTSTASLSTSDRSVESYSSLTENIERESRFHRRGIGRVGLWPAARHRLERGQLRRSQQKRASSARQSEELTLAEPVKSNLRRHGVSPRNMVRLYALFGFIHLLRSHYEFD